MSVGVSFEVKDVHTYKLWKSDLSSRRQRVTFALNSESNCMCCFCLQGMIIPETIAQLKAMFEENSLRPWKSTTLVSRFLKFWYR